ncbi:hypothetical protein OJAV_G00046570 [Oryzias javanicus]|uniref:Migration and invasion inhibitory protein n=1 Tax=Oryzias javanicus TaxID=123683 RepID=A0A437DEL8_ORYJA|nr:hypothetical protein OJAV_G00046570 [Oryzias javanicus]
MSTHRLDALRERNKHLLTRLKQQKRGGLSGRISGRGEKKPGVLVTLTEGDRGPARAKPTVRFTDCDMRLHPKSTESPRGRAGGRMMPSDRDPTVHRRLTNTEERHPSRTEGDVQSRDVDQSDKDSSKRRLQPLLGYDWIAGVLDTEDSVVERPDEFFDDLRVFRSLNKDECVHAVQTELSDASLPASALLTDQEDSESNKDSHQCTFSYRINSRLFPVPLHSQDCCTVCKRLKSSHPHTTAEPALIRVNVPRSALLPPHKYKAHRRCSFDPSDSFGLPAHCLSGWSNTGQSSIPPPSSLDLRSNLQMTPSPDTEMEGLSESEPSRRKRFDQLSNVSLLARHNYQHFPPRRLESFFNPASTKPQVHILNAHGGLLTPPLPHTTLRSVLQVTDQMRKYSPSFHTPPDLPAFIHTKPMNSEMNNTAQMLVDASSL